MVASPRRAIVYGLAALVAPAGCTTAPPEPLCQETLSPWSADLELVSSEEIAALLEAYRPDSVVWEEAVLGAESHPVTLSVERTTGEMYLVTRRGTDHGCRPGPEQRVPVEITARVDGVLRTSHSAAVDFPGDWAAGTRFYYDGIAPVALDEQAALAAEEWLNGVTPNLASAVWGVHIDGSLEASDLSIQAETEMADGSRGRAVFAVGRLEGPGTR